MSNLNINLNLKALKNAGIMDIQGRTSKKQCLVIPIAENNLYTGEKGIYISLAAWENDKLQNEKTHLVKQSFSKEFRENMTEDERNTLPILGDIKPMAQIVREPVSTGTAVADYNDDLPF